MGSPGDTWRCIKIVNPHPKYRSNLRRSIDSTLTTWPKMHLFLIHRNAMLSNLLCPIFYWPSMAGIYNLYVYAIYDIYDIYIYIYSIYIYDTTYIYYTIYIYKYYIYILYIYILYIYIVSYIYTIYTIYIYPIKSLYILSPRVVNLKDLGPFHSIISPMMGSSMMISRSSLQPPHQLSRLRWDWKNVWPIGRQQRMIFDNFHSCSCLW